MVTEKILAAGEAQVEAAAAMRGHKKHVVAGKALTIASAFAPINADFVADSKVRNLGRLRRYTRVISSEVGGIERRLRVLQSGIEKLGKRASSNTRDTTDGLSEARRLCRAGRTASARAQALSATRLLPSAKMRPGTGLQRSIKSQMRPSSAHSLLLQ
jgi:hypothetical protein